MHEQYAATTSGVAPSLLLSLTHFLIQAASSASARAGVILEAKPKPLRTATNAKIVFMITPPLERIGAAVSRAHPALRHGAGGLFSVTISGCISLVPRKMRRERERRQGIGFERHVKAAPVSA